MVRKQTRGPWGIAPMSGKLGWGVARQAGDAVEVGVVTGQLGQTIGLHDRHDQGVVTEQSGLLAYGCRSGDHISGNHQNLDAILRNLLYRLAEVGEGFEILVARDDAVSATHGRNCGFYPGSIWFRFVRLNRAPHPRMFLQGQRLLRLEHAVFVGGCDVKGHTRRSWRKHGPTPVAYRRRGRSTTAMASDSKEQTNAAAQV